MHYAQKVLITSVAIMLGGATLAIAADASIHTLSNKNNLVVSGAAENSLTVSKIAVDNIGNF